MCSPLPILEMVLISYLVINIIIGDIAGTALNASYACFIIALLPIVWRNKTLSAFPIFVL
jgi:hypothetical protein